MFALVTCKNCLTLPLLSQLIDPLNLGPHACHFILFTAFYLCWIPYRHYLVTGKAFLFFQWSKYSAQHQYQYDHKVTTNQDFEIEFENLLMHSGKKS